MPVVLLGANAHALAGWEDVYKVPELSTTAQNDADGHEIVPAHQMPC